jgi:hypothetical protein
LACCWLNGHGLNSKQQGTQQDPASCVAVSTERPQQLKQSSCGFQGSICVSLQARQCSAQPNIVFWLAGRQQLKQSSSSSSRRCCCGCRQGSICVSLQARQCSAQPRRGEGGNGGCV